MVKCFWKDCVKLVSEVSLLDHNQYAYLAERGVKDALPTMINNVYEQLQQARSPVKIAFVDFSIAFNTIQPHLLVDKLVDLWVNPNRIVWTQSFLTFLRST